MTEFKGIIAPLITPFDSEERVDLDAIDRIVGRLRESGIDGLFVCGGTGEWWALTEEERIVIAERVMDSAEGQVPLMVHVGATTSGSAVRLARHAERIGAAAISALPPTGFAFSADDVWRHFRLIADACRLPLYLYHFPQIYGDAIGIDRFIEEAATIPNLAGVKFSSYQIDDLVHLQNQTDGRLNILSGCAEQLLSGMICGAAGSICTWYNLFPRLAAHLLEQLGDGDLDGARQSQKIIVFLAKSCQAKHLAICKALLTLRGIDAGVPRHPIPRVESGEAEEIANEFKTRGYWDWFL